VGAGMLCIIGCYADGDWEQWARYQLLLSLSNFQKNIYEPSSNLLFPRDLFFWTKNWSFGSAGKVAKKHFNAGVHFTQGILHYGKPKTI
tara:strand:+ start:580 stop:846 length:267 start_codon:yes stop_codon:yes gene_type:complete